MRLSLLLILSSALLLAQSPAPRPAPTAEREGRNHEQDQLMRTMQDIHWRLQLGDIADVDEVTYTSLPPARIPNPTAPGAKNPMVIHSHVFIPKNLDKTKKHPFLLYVHGGVHANFSPSSAHIIRELVEQGYSIIATDYRGSTGYGRSYYERIDYGGRENDDVYAGRQWMLDTYPFLDPARCGILGWSHGGMITLMNIFDHPESFAVAYAGVPVSDLVARLGYQTESYRGLFSASYHIGKTVRDDIQEYLKRSPMTHVAKLKTPLLIHTNTNDEDVNYLEVARLAQALKAEGKKFEYKVYQDAPGGHSFNRLDTPLARESRKEIWRFLAPYLKPARPLP
ncbi:MAG: prolyl oligopeptidase family serine peptidase [Bryobacteraceae bacterium]|nr:prolyl oligopeptidase family serine peptidase [Bryobacteraceae bacterium]